MEILTQFVLRLSFGLAAAMALTSPRQVSSGYFRNNLYVLLGLNVLAALVGGASGGRLPLWAAVAAASLCYVGSVLWLYERPRAGIVALVFIALLDLVAMGTRVALNGPISASATASIPNSQVQHVGRVLWAWLDPPAGGLVLGLTLAAMLLGHWYLNSPTMELAPLRRLIRFSAVALVLRGVLCGAGLAMVWVAEGPPNEIMISILALCWLSGILGALWLAWLAMRTLDIPNTQTATGILYVAVIATFTGELASQLLSHSSRFPL